MSEPLKGCASELIINLEKTTLNLSGSWEEPHGGKMPALGKQKLLRAQSGTSSPHELLLPSPVLSLSKLVCMLSLAPMLQDADLQRTNFLFPKRGFGLM